MKKITVVQLTGRDSIAGPLTKMLRRDAKHLIQHAVEAELQELLMEHADYLMEDGKVCVVRNGYLLERELRTGIGPVTVKTPKVRFQTGEPVISRSPLICARRDQWRRYPSVSEGRLKRRDERSIVKYWSVRTLRVCEPVRYHA